MSEIRFLHVGTGICHAGVESWRRSWFLHVRVVVCHVGAASLTLRVIFSRWDSRPSCRGWIFHVGSSLLHVGARNLDAWVAFLAASSPQHSHSQHFENTRLTRVLIWLLPTKCFNVGPDFAQKCMSGLVSVMSGLSSGMPNVLNFDFFGCYMCFFVFLVFLVLFIPGSTFEHWRPNR